MKVLTLVVFILTLAISAAAQKAGQPDFQAMEKGAWDAFGKGDAKYFESFLDSDFTMFNGSTMANRADSIKGIATKPCTVKSYSFNNFKVSMIDPNTALVTYMVTQDVTCGTQAAPAKVAASTVYVKRGGKWMGYYHQESPVMGT